MPNRSSGDDFESPRIYPIPDNFAENTGVFGGMFPLRNFVEGVVFALPMLFIALSLPNVDLNTRIPLLIFLVSPPLILGCIGINGDSVTEFLIYWAKYRKRRRTARYNPRVKLEFTGDLDAGQFVVPIERVKRMMLNLSRKDRRETTESDRYYAVEGNIAFEDDLALKKKLAAEAERRSKHGGKKKAKRRG